MRKRFVSHVVASVIVSVVALAPTANSQTVPETASDHRPGDVVTDHGVGAVVPQPGHEIRAEAILADGSIQEFGIRTALDGRVTLLHFGDESAQAARPGDQLSEGGTPAATSPAPCDDNAYSVGADKVTSNFSWMFKISSTPSYLDQTGTKNDLKAGTDNITSAFNDCGRADNVSATNSYAQDTTMNVNITSSATCETPDDYSVVTFGDLSGSSVDPLAVECTDVESGSIVASDVKFEGNLYTWTLEPGSNCSGSKWDVESVMTHERGHSFGLEHVAESSHPYLTMSKRIRPCSVGARTLGLGDMLGLEALY